MEVSEIGVSTRARAMAMLGEETADNSRTVKRRKVRNEKLRSPSSTFLQNKTIDGEIYVNSAPGKDLSVSSDASSSLGSSSVPAFCCSSTGSIEKLKVADLEEESVETERAARNNLDESESTPASAFKAESDELDSTTTTTQSSEMINSSGTVLPAEKMPPAAELEEFFAAAQKDMSERFKERYNYDIVNDIPLKGRFKWIKLEPRK